MNSVCVTHIIFVGVFMTNLEMSNKTDAFGSCFCLRKKLSCNSSKKSYTNIKCVRYNEKLGCVKGFYKIQ